MNNIMASAQRFLRNKNTVTILGIIIILIILYIGYSSQINNAVSPVTVPVAATTIQPRTEITSDMVTTIDMPSISVSDNVITSSASIVGKYSNINTVIPKGSMFYTDTVITKDELPDSAFVKVKKGDVVYNFPVDMESTYGNSIFPGNKIDIYMKTGNGNDEKVMLGKLVANVEVLAVKDSSGKNVFENTEEDRTPAMLIFGVPEDINLLLRKASYMSSLGVELFPVPHGGKVSTEGATEVSTQQLADYIDAHAVNIPVTETTTTDELLPTIKITGSKIKTVTIKYPKSCKKNTCSYQLGSEGKVVKTNKKTFTTSLSDSQNIDQIVAIFTEKDGTVHTTVENISSDTTESTTSSTAATSIQGISTILQGQ